MKKHHRITKKSIKTFLLLLVPLLLLSIAFSHEHNTKADEEVVVTPYQPPNKPPRKFLGIWLSNGYGLQPPADSYTTVGTEVVLRTSAGRSIWSVALGLFDSVHFRWYKSTDAGKTWSSVSQNDNGRKKNFPVTPTEVGTVWYQLDTQYYTAVTPIFKTHIYSQVAAVHAIPEPVNALSLKVTVDDKFLYSTTDKLSNITYAHATPNPTNATGQITWSVDRPDLATIDEDGQITANSQGLSGMVRATAVFTNQDGSTATGFDDVEVGGGLDDQTVNSGQTASFTPKGNTGGDGDDQNTGTVTVVWSKYATISSKPVQVASGSNTTYTTPPTTMADDDSYYQAKITFKTGISSKSITTNMARLTVIPAPEPEIELTNTIANQTYQDEADTDNLLNNVANLDNVTYHDTITNQSDEGMLKNGYYVIPMRGHTKVNSVKINGEVLDPDKYAIVDDSEDDSDDLVIDIDTLNTNEQLKIDVDTTVQNISDKDSFTFTPYIYGTDSSGQIYRQEGTKETINYISNQIVPTISDIDFGTITPYTQNILKYRPETTNSPNNIVEVTDNRREKKAMQVYVSQDNDFQHESENATLPASLRYYNGGQYVDILNQKTLLLETEDGVALDSISWNKADGLLLYINPGQKLTGSYSTTLNWYFENSL